MAPLKIMLSPAGAEGDWTLCLDSEQACWARALRGHFSLMADQRKWFLRRLVARTVLSKVWKAMEREPAQHTAILETLRQIVTGVASEATFMPFAQQVKHQGDVFTCPYPRLRKDGRWEMTPTDVSVVIFAVLMEAPCRLDPLPAFTSQELARCFLTECQGSIGDTLLGRAPVSHWDWVLPDLFHCEVDSGGFSEVWVDEAAGCVFKSNGDAACIGNAEIGEDRVRFMSDVEMVEFHKVQVVPGALVSSIIMSMSRSQLKSRGNVRQDSAVHVVDASTSVSTPLKASSKPASGYPQWPTTSREVAKGMYVSQLLILWDNGRGLRLHIGRNGRLESAQAQEIAEFALQPAQGTGNNCMPAQITFPANSELEQAKIDSQEVTKAVLAVDSLTTRVALVAATKMVQDFVARFATGRMPSHSGMLLVSPLLADGDAWFVKKSRPTRNGRSSATSLLICTSSSSPAAHSDGPSLGTRSRSTSLPQTAKHDKRRRNQDMQAVALTIGKDRKKQKGGE